jgi:hypothetical protein
VEPKKSIGGCLTVIVILLAAIVYIVYLWNQINNSNDRAVKAEKNYQEVISIKQTDAELANQTFLEKFFTYISTKERYEGIKPLMTDKGYRSTFPSGMELPDGDQSVISKMTDLKGYVYLISKVELEMFNEFELSTTFNGSENKQTVIVRTKLLYEQGADWKIDEVEFVGEFTGRIGRVDN